MSQLCATFEGCGLVHCTSPSLTTPSRNSRVWKWRDELETARRTGKARPCSTPTYSEDSDRFWCVVWDSARHSWYFCCIKTIPRQETRGAARPAGVQAKGHSKSAETTTGEEGLRAHSTVCWRFIVNQGTLVTVLIRAHHDGR